MVKNNKHTNISSNELIELSDYRTVGPLNCRTKELSDHNYALFFLVVYNRGL